MAFKRTLLVFGVLLLVSLLAQGDAQQKDQKTSADVKPARPETHGGAWSGGGWGGWGPWGGGGWGGGWGGRRGGGWSGGGYGWGGSGCGYRCGHHGQRCCTPQEIAEIKKSEAMNPEEMMTEEVKPEAVVGTQGYGGGGWSGGGGHGKCHHYCYGRCCTPEEIANNPELMRSESEAKGAETKSKESKVDPKTVKQGYGSKGYGGGGHGADGAESHDVKPERPIGTKGYGGGGGGGGWSGGGGKCHHYCHGHCCTPEEIANNPDLLRSESEAKGAETKNKESKVDSKTVKQGEVKN